MIGFLTRYCYIGDSAAATWTLLIFEVIVSAEVIVLSVNAARRLWVSPRRALRTSSAILLGVATLATVQFVGHFVFEMRCLASNPSPPSPLSELGVLGDATLITSQQDV